MEEMLLCMEVNDIRCVWQECVLQSVSEKAAVPIKTQMKLSDPESALFFFPRRIFASSLNKSTGAGKCCLLSYGKGVVIRFHVYRTPVFLYLICGFMCWKSY